MKSNCTEMQFRYIRINTQYIIGVSLSTPHINESTLLQWYVCIIVIIMVRRLSSITGFYSLPIVGLL